MKEQIRELARQAEFSEKDLHKQGDNFQMFAELIVRECAQIAETAEPYQSHDLILKHFGVEE